MHRTVAFANGHPALSTAYAFTLFLVKYINL